MRFTASLLLLALAFPAVAAERRTKPKPGTDEFAIETTVLAVYNVVSGPAGRRDWNRFKDLFAPGARITAFRAGEVTSMTPDECATQSKPYLDANGLFSMPVDTRIDRFADIAHVTSRYEARHATTDAAPFERGVGHVELLRIGDGWKILSIVWETE
jgi:hypothetical protein